YQIVVCSRTQQCMHASIRNFAVCGVKAANVKHFLYGRLCFSFLFASENVNWTGLFCVSVKKATTSGDIG
ncbi:hypothetical protein J8J32_21830, partial [Mycobacterium tuberculosis]|nr:hypothetical protein [Mycobacterium tuberculosis]